MRIKWVNICIVFKTVWGTSKVLYQCLLNKLCWGVSCNMIFVQDFGIGDNGRVLKYQPVSWVQETPKSVCTHIKTHLMANFCGEINILWDYYNRFYIAYKYLLSTHFWNTAYQVLCNCFTYNNSFNFHNNPMILSLHSTDEEMEAQRSWTPCQSHTAIKRQSLNWYSGSLAPETRFLNTNLKCDIFGHLGGSVG